MTGNRSVYIMIAAALQSAVTSWAVWLASGKMPPVLFVGLWAPSILSFAAALRPRDTPKWVTTLGVLYVCLSVAWLLIMNAHGVDRLISSAGVVVASVISFALAASSILSRWPDTYHEQE